MYKVRNTEQSPMDYGYCLTTQVATMELSTVDHLAFETEQSLIILPYKVLRRSLVQVGLGSSSITPAYTWLLML